MRERGEPFKQILNNAVRQGLLHGRDKAQHGKRAASLPMFHMGLPSVGLSVGLGHANRVAEQLEDERLLDKLRRGR